MMALDPVTREEIFLAKAAGMDVEMPEPITRKEMFLSRILVGGNGGGGSEPADGDMPKVFIDGIIPTTKDEVPARLRYVSKTESFTACLLIKCQGSSSMAYPKKNFTIKMYADEARKVKLKKTFKDWECASHKYVLKANYIDHSHARNIVGARLWNETVSSRPDYNALPAELRNSPRNGAIDGFPIKVYTNGTYQGVYTWTIGKDDWMWGMDEDNPSHVLMCAESNIGSGTFNALWDGTNGTEWSVEVGTNSDAVKNSLNALISCVMDADDATFKATIGNHLDIRSAIDYYIHQYVICGMDGLGKNLLLGTYDGTKWICGAYDMDSTFGLYWDGTRFLSPQLPCPGGYTGGSSRLWPRIAALFAEEMKQRYFELRDTVYSIGNMVAHFEQFMDIIGLELLAEDLTVYPEIPSADTNNIKQLRDFIRDRREYVDGCFGYSAAYALYSLPEAVTLDGETCINTHIMLSDHSEYTVCLDFTMHELDSADNAVVTLLDNYQFSSTNGYPGWRINCRDAEGDNARFSSQTEQKVPIFTKGLVGNRHRLCVRKQPDGTLTLFTDDLHTSGVTVTTPGHDHIEHPVIVGAFWKWGTPEEYAKMTVHGCEIYTAALSNQRISEYLNEG